MATSTNFLDKTDDQSKKEIALFLNVLASDGQRAATLKKVKSPEDLVLRIRYTPDGEALYAQVESLRLRENGDEIFSVEEAVEILSNISPVVRVAQI